MVQDIGYMLFKEILGMTEYPGGPFSGVILKDLVMFFLIPTIFIILVIYMMLGRLLPHEYRGMRLLVGIGAYLFILFGGYYAVFARLAGPYFIFLIFIMGILYFFIEHFTKRSEAGGTRGGGPYGGGHSAGWQGSPSGGGGGYTGQPVASTADITSLKAYLRSLANQIELAAKKNEPRLEGLRMEFARVEAQLSNMQTPGAIRAFEDIRAELRRKNLLV